MKEVHATGVKDLRPWDASSPAQNRELRRVVSRNTEPLSPGPVAEPKKHSIPGQCIFRYFAMNFIRIYFGSVSHRLVFEIFRSIY